MVNDLLGTPEPSAQDKQKLLQTKQNIFAAIVRERHVQDDFLKSIARLQEALVSLDQDQQSSGHTPNERNLWRRANLNADGVIDALDFAILTQLWLYSEARP